MSADLLLVVAGQLLLDLLHQSLLLVLFSSASAGLRLLVPLLALVPTRQLLRDLLLQSLLLSPTPLPIVLRLPISC